MKGENRPYPAEIVAIRELPYGLRGFRRFAKLLGVDLKPFQVFLMGLFFAGVRELIILIPKKNGKTTLLAVLALYHLLMVENAEVVIGAASKEQASTLHRQATSLIFAAGLERKAVPDTHGRRRTTTLYEGVFEVREGMHVIRFATGRLRVMPHEARTGDGVIPTLALVDELHRHPTGELYRIWRAGLLEGAQMVTISTAGSSLDSPLGKLLEVARTYPFERKGKRTVYRSKSGSVVLVEYALAPGDDPDNLRNVKQANPAPWITYPLLRERRESPMETPGSWARLTCNLWVEGEEPAISSQAWDRLYSDIGQVQDGEDVYLAPSVGQNAAIGIAASRPDGRVAVRAEILTVPEGGSIMAAFEDRIVELCERYRVIECHHPRGGYIRSQELLQVRGVPIVDAPHHPTRITAVSGAFDRLMRAGLLIHDGDPQVRKHVLAAVRHSTETGERYVMDDRSRAIIALAMAAYPASAPQEDLRIVLPGAV